jgi:antitoxin component of MazEF toxin-antitoxin module
MNLPAFSVRRILAVGGSKAVAMPPGWLKMYGLELGDTVELYADSLLFLKPKSIEIDFELVRRELVMLANITRKGKI